MDLSGSREIAAPPEVVWRGLNDPETLRKAIPGCETLTKLSDNEFEATAGVAIGPVKAKFKGKIRLADLNPPTSYTISGEGQGGVAGFAKGEAKVSLAPIAGGTRLDYDVKAQVGGKLAQVGQRLIDGAAKKMADEFFENFSTIVAPPSAEAEAVAAPEESEGLPQSIWIPLLIAALALLIAAAIALS